MTSTHRHEIDVGTSLEDGEFEQSSMVHLFLGCVDCTGERHTAFVSCQERPMPEDEQQTQTLDEGVWAIVDDGCNSCCHGESWRRNTENTIHHKGLEAVWLHRKGDHVQWSGNEHDKWKTEVGDGCEIYRNLVSSFQVACTHGRLEKSHPVLINGRHRSVSNVVVSNIGTIWWRVSQGFNTSSLSTGLLGKHLRRHMLRMPKSQSWHFLTSLTNLDEGNWLGTLPRFSSEICSGKTPLPSSGSLTGMGQYSAVLTSETQQQNSPFSFRDAEAESLTFTFRGADSGHLESGQTTHSHSEIGSVKAAAICGAPDVTVSASAIGDQVCETHEESKDFRQRLVESVSQCESNEWRHIVKLTSLSTPMLNAFFDEAEHIGKYTQFPNIHRTWIKWLECG